MKKDKRHQGSKKNARRESLLERGIKIKQRRLLQKAIKEGDFATATNLLEA